MAPILDHAGTRPQLRTAEFERISQLIYQSSGIALSHAKRSMVEIRLAKRLRVLGLQSFTEYCTFLFSPLHQERELVSLVDAITVNRTDFFREPVHFDYLVQTAVPTLSGESGGAIRRPLAVWSAACSTGEEPYTLAMVLDDLATRQGTMPQFSVLGTDICTRVLETATRAIYPEAATGPVPRHLFCRYFLRSRQKDKAVVRISPEIRSYVRFERTNLVHGTLVPCKSMDVVFCRNVIIYFDSATQHAVMKRIADRLRPGGYLFMGHSETLNFLDLPLTQVAATVYRRLG